MISKGYHTLLRELLKSSRGSPEQITCQVHTLSSVRKPLGIIDSQSNQTVFQGSILESSIQNKTWNFQQIRMARQWFEIPEKDRYRLPAWKVYITQERPGRHQRKGRRPSWVSPIDMHLLDKMLRKVVFVEHAIPPIIKFGQYMNPSQVAYILHKLPKMMRYQKTRMDVTEVQHRILVILQKSLRPRLVDVIHDMTAQELTRSLASICHLPAFAAPLQTPLSAIVPELLPSLEHGQAISLAYSLAKLGPGTAELGKEVLRAAATHSQPTWTFANLARAYSSSHILKVPLLSKGVPAGGAEGAASGLLATGGPGQVVPACTLLRVLGRVTARGLLSCDGIILPEVADLLGDTVVPHFTHEIDKKHQIRLLKSMYRMDRAWRKLEAPAINARKRARAATKDTSLEVSDALTVGGLPTIAPVSPATARRKIRWLVKRIVQRLRLPGLSVAETLNAMRLCASMKVHGYLLYRRMIRRLLPDLRRLTVPQMVLLARLCAKTRSVDLFLMNQLGDQLAARKKDLDPTSANLVLTAFLRLDLPHTALLMALYDRLDRDKLTPEVAGVYDQLMFEITGSQPALEEPATEAENAPEAAQPEDTKPAQ